MLQLEVLAWPAFNYKPFNPYNWLLNKNLERTGVSIIPFSIKNVFFSKFNIWHIHWPAENVLRGKNFTTYVRLTGFILILIYVKYFRNKKIVWTVHNHTLHDGRNPLLSELFFNILSHFISGLIFLSKNSREEFLSKRKNYIGIKNKVIPHGHYKDWYPNEVDIHSARAKLNIGPNQFVILFTGSIRPYKNVEQLIDIFNSLKDPNIFLLIAGKPSTKELENLILQKISKNKNILFSPDWVRDEDFQFYFNAANLVVLPYNSILNSGAAILALSYNRPVLVPKIPSLLEYKELLRTDHIIFYDGELNKDMLQTTIGYLKKNTLDKINLEPLSWDNISKETKLFYEEIFEQ